MQGKSPELFSFTTAQLEKWEKRANPRICFVCCGAYMHLYDMAYEVRKISEV